MDRNSFSRVIFRWSLVAIFLSNGTFQDAHAAAANVITVAVPTGDRAMAAKIDAQGIVHLICENPQGPHYLRYDSNVRKFLGAPIAILDEASRQPGLEFITWDMSVTPEGAVHVALGNNAWKLKLPQDEWGYFYTRLLPSEMTFLPLKNINHKPSEGFSIAVKDDGTITGVWMADKLYANVSRDGGNTFAPAVEIDPALDPCNCCTTSSTYGTDGRLAILYREETDNQRDMYLALWDQEQNEVTKTLVSTTPWKTDSCPMTYYSVIRNDEGFIAAWPTKGEIYFAKLDLNGLPLAPKETKTPGANGMRSGILPIPTRDGQTLVIWKKDNQLGWQRYDTRGRPSGPPGSVKSTGPGAAGVVAKDGDFLLFQ